MSQDQNEDGSLQENYYEFDKTNPREVAFPIGESGFTVQGTYGRFVYTGADTVLFGGLGTIWKEETGSRGYGYTEVTAPGGSKYRNESRWLAPTSQHYEYGVVKGVFDEETGDLEKTWTHDGDKGFNWTGVLAIGSGAIVQNIGSKDGLKTTNTETKDTWNPVIEQDISKILHVLAGGSAHNVAVTGRVTNYEITSAPLYKSNAGLVVSSGGKVTDLSILSGGMAIAIGGSIDGAFVGSGGILYLSGWGGAHQVSEDGGEHMAGALYQDETLLNNVRLDKGGQVGALYDAHFSGTAPSIIANKAGGVLNGITANGVEYISGVDFAGMVNLGKDQKALDVVVRGYTKITKTDADGTPKAWTTTIATMNVSSGGIVRGATVGEDGAIYVSDGADVSNLTASGGRLIFENVAEQVGGGKAWNQYLPGSAAVAGLTIRDGGILAVNSKFALTATDMQIHESAGLEVVIVKDADEKYAKTELNGAWTAPWGGGEFRTADGVLTGFGGQFGYKYVEPVNHETHTSARLSMTFLNGGTLNGGDLRGYGHVTASNGGKILNAKLKGITANIGAGGYASGLSAITDPTNSAYQTNFYVYGNGALAEQTVLNGGYMDVSTGGVANDVTMLAPEGYEGPAGNDKTIGPAELEITNGGTVNDLVASAGVITMCGDEESMDTEPVKLSNAEIHSAVTLVVKADGVVLDGAMKLAGTVVTKASREVLVEIEVTDPETGITGKELMHVEKNNAVANASTLTVTFDLTERDGGEETMMIDCLANLQGVTLDTVIVSEDQMGGKYGLAGGSEGYAGALKLIRGGEYLGTITAGESIRINDDLTYKLSNTTDQGLVLSVLTKDAEIENLIVTSDGKELQKGKWSQYAINIKTEVNQYSKSIWYRIRKANRKGSAADADEGWLEFDSENGITLSEYCTVEFKAKNEEGKDSRIVSYTVNYDDTPATFADLRIDSDEPFLQAGVESEVSVEALDDLDNALVVEVKAGDGKWTKAELQDDGRYGFTLAGNADFTLRATDHAGNITELSLGIPADPVVTADITTPTNQDVTLTAQFSPDSTVRQYSTDGGKTWYDYSDDGVVLQENATVRFRAENICGQSGIAVCTVDCIDKTPPADPVAEGTITGITTDQPITVTATFSDDSAVREYSLNGRTWLPYTGGVVMDENGTVRFRAKDAVGNVSGVVEYKINKIVINGPDHHRNDLLFDENGNLNENIMEAEGIVIEGGAGPILLDTSVRLLVDGVSYRNFVGGDDNADYAQITMASAAKLRFCLSSYNQDKKGKVKFSLISYDPATGRKKNLKSATSSNNKSAMTSGFFYVDPNDPKTAGLLYFAAVENKGTTDVFYNVDLTADSCIYADGDKGDNNGPLLVSAKRVKSPNAAQIEKFQTFEITKSGTQQPVVFDTNAITAADAPAIVDGWSNFVGFGDDNDYVKLSATQPVKLKFTIKATGNVKLVVYSLSNKTGKWVQTAKTLTVSLKRAEKNELGYATRFLEVSLDRPEGTEETGYYVSVQSTNAKTGGQAWYNVSVDSTVCPSDFGTNGDLLVDKYTPNSQLRFTEIKGSRTKIATEAHVPDRDDISVEARQIGKKTYENFVGLGDEWDYAEIKISQGGKLTLELDVTGTAKQTTKLVLYKLTLKANGTWSKSTVTTVSARTVLDTTLDTGVGYAARTVTIREKNITKVEGQAGDIRYFVGIQAGNARKGTEAYYTAYATLEDIQESALAMPETDSLAMTDSLSFGQYDADALADASASALADLDDKSSWQSLLA